MTPVGPGPTGVKFDTRGSWSARSRGRRPTTLRAGDPQTAPRPRRRAMEDFRGLPASDGQRSEGVFTAEAVDMAARGFISVPVPL